MKALLTTIAIAAALTLSACGGTATPIGNPEVHTRIAAMTDCDQLQAEFDLSATNGDIARGNGNLELAKATTAYMHTALNRQNELKCFG